MERYVRKEVNDIRALWRMIAGFEKAPEGYESHCTGLCGKL